MIHKNCLLLNQHNGDDANQNLKKKRLHSKVWHQPIYFTFKRYLLFQKPTNNTIESLVVWWWVLLKNIKVILLLNLTLGRSKALGTVNRNRTKVCGHNHVSSVLSCGKQLSLSFDRWMGLRNGMGLAFICMEWSFTVYAFFWVITRRLNFIRRRFGTLCSIFIGR